MFLMSTRLRTTNGLPIVSYKVLIKAVTIFAAYAV